MTKLLRIFLCSMVLSGTFQVGCAAELSAGLKKWEECLKVGLKKVDGPLLLDVPVTKDAPTFGLKDGAGQASLARLGWTLGLDLHINDGSAALLRTPEAPGIAELSDSSRLITLLEGLPAETIRSLATSGAAVSDLSPELQRGISRLAGSSGGLSDKIGNGDFVYVKLFLCPVATYADPKTGQQKAASLGSYSFTAASEEDSRSKSAKRALQLGKSHDPEQPLVNGQDIDFGEGQVLRLIEVASKVRTQILYKISYDPRLDDAPIFIKGKFSKEAIVKDLVEFCEAQKPRAFPWTRENRGRRLDSIIGAMKDVGMDSLEGLGKLSSSDVYSGLKADFKSLVAKSPYLASLFSGGQLSGSTPMTLSMRLGVSLFADGSAPLPGGTTGPDGKSRDLLVPNYLRFRIDP